MKRLLFLLLFLPSVAFSANINKVALFYSKSDVVGNSMGSPDELMCLEVALRRGGWVVDRFNASTRTWGGAPDTSDGEWFAARYAAAIIINADLFNTSLVLNTIGYGSNFQNSASLARVAEGPLGGRWKIPVLVLAENIVPSTSFDDTTTNRFVAGITHTGPAGSFAKPAVATAGTWRYRMLGRLNGSNLDTLYADPEFFACRPSSWTGAGQVAALLWSDSVFASCTGTDTVMVAWRWRPRSDRPGVVYCLLTEDYTQTACDGALWVLQYIAATTAAKPSVVTNIQITEHNSSPISLTATRVANYYAFRRKLIGVNCKLELGPVCPGDISVYNRDIGIANNEALVAGSKWYAFGQFGFYNSSDTANARQLFNSNINCSTHPDSMMLRRDAYFSREAVSGGGIVGVMMGKVLKDAGVDAVVSTQGASDNTNWRFLYSQSSTPLFPNTLPDGSGRIIYVRSTWPLGDNETWTGRLNGVGAYEYLGSTFVKGITAAAIKNSTLYYHTANNIGNDTYHQWLFGDVLVRQIRYFNLIMRLDVSTPQINHPVAQ